MSLRELNQSVADFFDVDADFVNDQQNCWWGISHLEERGWDYSIYGRANLQVLVEFYRGGKSFTGEAETFMIAFCQAVDELASA